jgi:hypothetical protein
VIQKVQKVEKVPENFVLGYPHAFRAFSIFN